MKPEEALVGTRVRFRDTPPVLPGLVPTWTGIITELRPQNGGVLVRPDGLDQSFGWGYEELILEPIIIGPSVWEWLRNPAV